jgi:integrase
MEWGMGMKKLTARFVDNVKEPGKYYDANNLFLRVYKAGSRNWVQRVTINGKRKEIGLGNANLIPLSEAREVAFDNLRMVKKGIDPVAITEKKKSIPTFEEAALKVYEINRPSWTNEKHAAQFISTLKTYAFHHIGELKVDRIETSHILSILTPIWVSKADTAKKVRQRLSTVLKYCKAQKWRSDDPADRDIIEALPKQMRKSNHMKSMDYREVGSFITDMKNSFAGTTTKLALEFLILNASRSGEVRFAKWNEIKEKTWTIPAERMKAKITHRIPLSERCLEILKEAESISQGSDYIFCGYKKDKPLSENTFNKLIKELGYDVHTHGFRTSFKTWTQEKTNYPREVAEKQLAHSLNDKAEAAYARSELMEKRNLLLESWGLFVGVSDNKIIPLKGNSVG